MVKVRFSASGFGSTTYEHADEESAWAAMRADAREVADEHGGEVNEAGDEIVVARPGGDENRKMGTVEISKIPRCYSRRITASCEPKSGGRAFAERTRQMKTKTKNKAAERKPLADPKEASRKVRHWLLKTHPEEKPLIGDFRKDVTFAEVNRRMHKGEGFYDICSCGESVQRELVFAEMARIYAGTDYDYWYDLWLNGGRDDALVKKLIKAIQSNPRFTLVRRMK